MDFPHALHRGGPARQAPVPVRPVPTAYVAAVALNRVALRPHADLIGGLAERLDETKRSVAPAGVVRVRRLLTGPESPLYLGSGADIEAQSHEAERELARALRSLEVR
jgi:hypothetical protein